MKTDEELPAFDTPVKEKMNNHGNVCTCEKINVGISEENNEKITGIIEEFAYCLAQC